MELCGGEGGAGRERGASVPDWVQSSEHYRAQLVNCGGDPGGVVLPPEFSDFSLQLGSIEDLRRHVRNRDYWGVTELDRDFYSLD